MVDAARAGREDELGPDRDWVGIAANAGSGLGRGQERVRLLVAELSQLGFRSQVAWTPGERTELVAMANEDPRARCLVAAGGDGTVAALINEHPNVPVTVLPVGTENLFSRHFHLGAKPRGLARTIAAGRVTPLDLGLVAGRRFALMAGVGFDADVVTRHHLARNRTCRSNDADESSRPVRRTTCSDRPSATGFPSSRSISATATRSSLAPPRFFSTCLAMPWGCRSPRRPWVTTACSIWSCSIIPWACAPFTISGWCCAVLHLRRLPTSITAA